MLLYDIYDILHLVTQGCFKGNNTNITALSFVKHCFLPLVLVLAIVPKACNNGIECRKKRPQPCMTTVWHYSISCNGSAVFRLSSLS